MNSILNDVFIGEKKICPYKERCYRKNPVHFTEMSHPHLENLIVDQLDKSITIPNKLEFECPDRSQLLEQLKVLQMVMKKERERNGEIKKPQSNSKPKTPSKDDKELSNLKDKIEKHKQAALQKRENRLKEMDNKAAKINEGSETRTATGSKKKMSAHSSPDEPAAKKVKSNDRAEGSKKILNSSNSSIDSQSSSQSTSSQGSSLSSNSKRSLMDSYIEASNDRSRRQKNRDEAIAKMILSGHKVPSIPQGEFALKFALSAPYHYFLNRVEKSKETYDQQFTVSFPELLDISLGEIVDSLHINFMVEVGWLCLQYLLAAQNPKMTIFCGSVCDPVTKLPPNMTLVLVKMPTAYGCHHSKISVLKYSDDGIRIIVSTANVYSDDWENRTQGLWISPHLPKLPESANTTDGESPTNFKKCFREYLAFYKHPKLVEWEHLIKRADFSEVNVFFVASVPGSHKGLALDSWGHRRLAAILSEHAVLPPDAPQWTLVAQSSSIGSLGPNYESWLLSNLVASMTREKAKGIKSNPNFQFIYPSLRNYESSFDCKVGSSCLPYSRKSHQKQEWLNNYLYQWKADETARTKAIPHIKSYTRISPDQTKIPWFVLTSANLSKGAWGTTAKARTSHFIMNYEAGVVFIPKFIINDTTFPIKEPSTSDVPVFRIPYDLPLTRYQSNDTPFVAEFLIE